VNVVCLTGRLARVPGPLRGDVTPRPGWGNLVLEAPRRTAAGEGEPGVIQVLLALPPQLATSAAATLQPGRAVSVVGMLDVDVDLSVGSPRAYHSVIAQQIETVADPFAGDG
jgi:hypothetical protein